MLVPEESINKYKTADQWKEFLNISALAYDCKVDGIYYDLNNDDKTASVTNTTNNKYVGDIIIPESITYSGTTYSVTSIGRYAFRGCSGLTSVTIGNSVTSIGNNAFADCSMLTSVSIGNSVTSIGDRAFFKCSGLTSVTIPNSVTTIGKYAFCDCSGLTSVTIPNSVTSIGEGAFYDCSGLTSVDIPNSVTTIGGGAFSGCSGLTSVTIGNSVTSIGKYAFCGCSGLTSVTIPNSVTSIGECAFESCSGLTSVTVDKNNGTYDSRDNCNAIIETSTNTLIVGCKNTTIPNSVTSIGRFAFYGCSGLTSVTIPNSVTSIGEGAFAGCSGLTSVTVDKNNGTYNSRDNCNAIIETSTNKLIVGCKNTIIPNSVTSIGNGAFYSCWGLTSVTIPNSVTSIGDGAFDYCLMLRNLTSLAVEPPTCGIGAFKYVDKTSCQLLVPEESINKYKTADQWKEFLNILGYNGVDDVSVDSQNAVYEVYNLQGVRVGGGMREEEVTADVLPHGVYILVSPQSRKKLKI